ncbi:hypothetical protein SCA6_000154 [Theobroma cacao]
MKERSWALAQVNVYSGPTPNHDDTELFFGLRRKPVQNFGLNNKRKETARNCSAKRRNSEAEKQQFKESPADFESGKPYISLIVH